MNLRILVSGFIVFMIDLCEKLLGNDSIERIEKEKSPLLFIEF
jgi:hypothetical protein